MRHFAASIRQCRHSGATRAHFIQKCVLVSACTCESQAFGIQGCRRRTMRRTPFYYESGHRRTSVTHGTGGCTIPKSKYTPSLDNYGVRTHTAYKNGALCSLQDG